MQNALKSILHQFLIKMNINVLEYISEQLPKKRKNASSILGHGSPMNAIEENQFVRGFRKFLKIPTPMLFCVFLHIGTPKELM